MGVSRDSTGHSKASSVNTTTFWVQIDLVLERFDHVKIRNRSSGGHSAPLNPVPHPIRYISELNTHLRLLSLSLPFTHTPPSPTPHSPSHAPSRILTLLLSHAPPLTLPLSHAPSRILTLPFSHAPSLTLPLSHAPSRILTLPLAFSRSLSLTLPFSSLPLCLSPLSPTPLFRRASQS